MSATGSSPSTEPDTGGPRPGVPSGEPAAGPDVAGAAPAHLSAPPLGRRVLAGAPWLLLAAAATVLFVLGRGRLDESYAVLGYLLVVLGGSSRLGRAWGIVLAIACFLALNFFLLPPYGTLALANPLEWFVLFGFLVTSIVAAQLLYRAQAETEVARARASEVDRLSILGAETLNAGRAEDGVEAIARVLRDRLHVGECAVHQRVGEDMRLVARVAAPDADEPDPIPGSLLRAVAARGAVALERADGSVHMAEPDMELEQVLERVQDSRAVVVPLRVRGEVVGVLRLADERGLRLDAPARRFAGALAYYAALGVERVQLAATAERAQALREADRLKDALLASVSHDLRTPLTTIKALAHEIRADGDDRAAVVEEEADRLNRFVSNLLDLSRSAGGALEPVAELVPADELLGAALQQAEAIRGDHEIRVTMPAADRVPIGRFDLSLALRALVNLLENACKYSPSAAPIDVVLMEGEGILQIDVADRGPGIPDADSERVFEPFYRGAAVARMPGTGLGLSIARRLAEAQGGSVGYVPRPGGGSVFTLILPAGQLSDLSL